MRFFDNAKMLVASVILLIIFSAIWAVGVYVVWWAVVGEDLGIFMAFEHGAFLFLAIGWIKNAYQTMSNAREEWLRKF